MLPITLHDWVVTTYELNTTDFKIANFITVKGAIGIAFKAMKIMLGLNYMRCGIAHPMNTWIIICQGNTKGLFATQFSLLLRMENQTGKYILLLGMA